jgi:hypothetical protein
MTKKVMKLIDPSTGEMKCKICGATKYAGMVDRPFARTNRWRPGSWQCVNKCNFEQKSSIVYPKF